jgi:5-formyltetrahydrofolate cyclo-ligase
MVRFRYTGDMSGTVEAKRSMRRAIKAVLAAISPETREEWSERAFLALSVLPEYRKADIVLAFLSMDEEIDTGFLIESVLAQGRSVYAPRIEGADIGFHRIESMDGAREKGAFGIREPGAASPRFDPDSETGNILVLVPGLAFDRTGFRLGRGKGYYDRFLASIGGLGAFRAGFGFSAQIVDSVPHDERDVRLDAVVTEEGVFRA